MSDDQDLLDLIAQRRKRREAAESIDDSHNPFGTVLIGLGGGLASAMAGNGKDYAGDAFKERDAQDKIAYDKRMKALDAFDDEQKGLTDLAKFRMSEKNLDKRAANELNLKKMELATKVQLAGMKAPKGMHYEIDPATGEQQLVPDEDKIKPSQYQAGTFGKRIEQAEGDFGKLADAGYDPTSLFSSAQRLPIMPEMLKTEQAKLQEQAERNFVNALLRRESGAAISKSEFDSAEKQYFPRSGDTPEVLQQKAVNRQIAQGGLKAEAGPAWGKIEKQLSSLPPTTIPNTMRKGSSVRDEGLLDSANASENGPTLKTPKVGEVVRGYVYTGGAPSDPHSWAKAKQ